MRVFLEVVHGPAAGQKAELADGQSLVVGRSDDCGLIIARDPYVSRQHCELHVESSKCLLKNLSSNGTRVNGTTADQPTSLSERDEIEIGQQTVMRVQFHADRDLQATAVPALSETQTAVGAATNRAGGDAPEMVVCTLPYAAVTPEWLQDEAVEPWPGYLIVDFSKLKLQPAGFSGGEPLMNWLPENIRSKNSPVILSIDEVQDVASLFGASLRKDALIVVYSSEEPPDLYQKLRDVAGVFGAPSVFLANLAASEPKYLKHLFSRLEAVVVEDPAKECWTLFCTSEFQRAVAAN